MFRLFMLLGLTAAFLSTTTPAEADNKCFDKCSFKHQGRPKKIPKCINKCELKRAGVCEPPLCHKNSR
jgi:hypothetical protein